MRTGQKPGTKWYVYDRAWVTADSGEESLLFQQYTFTPPSKSWALSFPDKTAVPFIHSIHQISLSGKSRNKGSSKTQVGIPQELSYCLLQQNTAGNPSWHSLHWMPSVSSWQHCSAICPLSVLNCSGDQRKISKWQGNWGMRWQKRPLKNQLRNLSGGSHIIEDFSCCW